MSRGRRRGERVDCAPFTVTERPHCSRAPAMPTNDTASNPAALLLHPLQLGPVRLPNRLFLAPMAGVTDRPFRTLCRELGAGLTVSEMVAANPALRQTRKSRERRDHAGEPGPIAIQIAGSDPARMAAAARENVDTGAELIDINLGCPAKKVCRVAAGSALLRDEVLVGRILEAVVNAVAVPVTLKTRTGWSPASRNLARIAQIAQDSGIAMLTVHGRTRACGYQGAAEHDSLAAIREHTRIPLVANGDIDGPEQAFRVLKQTQADAIMIGRAALGRPWIFNAIATAARAAASALPRDGEPSAAVDAEGAHAADWTPAPSAADAIIEAHLARLYAFYGELRGVRVARKHIGWYLQGLGKDDTLAAHERRQILTATTADEQLRLLRELLQRLADVAPERMLAA